MNTWQAWQARASQVAAPPAPPDEPLIDGYPLWSGIPQPAEQAELSDAAESLISYLESLGIENKAMDYLRAVLAAAKGRRS